MGRPRKYDRKQIRAMSETMTPTEIARKLGASRKTITDALSSTKREQPTGLTASIDSNMKPSEKRAVVAAAAITGETVSAYVRRVVMAFDQLTPIPSPHQ